MRQRSLERGPRVGLEGAADLGAIAKREQLVHRQRGERRQMGAAPREHALRDLGLHAVDVGDHRGDGRVQRRLALLGRAVLGAR